MAPKLQISRSAAIAPDDDGYLVFDTATGQLAHLNATAALVAELCDGTRTATEIEHTLALHLGDTVATACRDWIHSAIACGLLHCDNPDDSATMRTAPIHAAPSVFADAARHLRQQGQVLPAFVCQWHAAHLDEADAPTWYGLGELAHIVGRRTTARDAYERYLTMTPDDAEIAHLLVSLRDDAAPARAPDRCIEQIYDRFASYYDDSMRGDLGYCAPEILGGAIHAVLGDRADLEVLELGCGTGLAGRVLRPRARLLIGVDLSPAMITRARSAGVYDDLCVSEITEWLTAHEETYDLIVLCDTLIYFGDLSQVVALARQRLNPNGALAFTIEAGGTRPFRLTDSGRYAHHPDHVMTVARDAGLAVASIETSTLRYEYGEPVNGLVVVFLPVLPDT